MLAVAGSRWFEREEFDDGGRSALAPNGGGNELAINARLECAQKADLKYGFHRHVQPLNS
jgi:hypothetical protein